MAVKEKNPHEGHRQRVREKFLKDGSFDSFPEHNILEMLLFYSTPRQDTNELAHRLIDRFGSLNAVLDAPYDALVQTKGIGENTAVLIKMIPELMNVYLKNKTAEMKYISDLDDCVKYLRPYFNTRKTEALIMLCLNNAGKILRTVTISEGASDFTQVDTRKIVHEVILCNATQVILAHNHPGGVCAPSRADIEVTSEIARLLYSIHAKLANHIIISENDCFSFATSEKFSSLFIAEDTYNSENSYAAEVN